MDIIDRDLLPHGTILCPTCGSSHSGCIDSPICDECGELFWPMELLERAIERVRKQLVDLKLDEKEHSFMKRKIVFKCVCLHKERQNDENICE
jgi:hypothetical protein